MCGSKSNALDDYTDKMIVHMGYSEEASRVIPSEKESKEKNKKRTGSCSDIMPAKCAAKVPSCRSESA